MLISLTDNNAQSTLTNKKHIIKICLNVNFIAVTIQLVLYSTQQTLVNCTWAKRCALTQEITVNNFFTHLQLTALVPMTTASSLNP